MSAGDLSETTQLLRAWAGGDEAALNRLTPHVYAELQRLAGRFMQGERSGHTLQTTALVHEAYMKLVNIENVEWQHKAHFFAVAAQVMRRILLDGARRRLAAKRGGAAVRVELDGMAAVGTPRAADLLRLDDALNALAGFDARKAQVVELRFFAGMSVDETAEVLKVSPDTVLRDWRLARSWLLKELSS